MDLGGYGRKIIGTLDSSRIIFRMVLELRRTESQKRFHKLNINWGKSGASDICGRIK